jgi:tetratricopeptide (TPR) repeat protein
MSRRITMKKLLTAVFALLLTSALSGQARAESADVPAKEILTAIDVEALIKSGSSDADIARQLSAQRGFDRDSALKDGQTDQQIIMKLITGAYAADNTPDKNKAVSHKFAGDKYLKESRYEKAATEYSIAIKYARDDLSLYKTRGDSYRQYLKSKLPAPQGVAGVEKRNASSARARGLLCSSITSDYKKVIALNSDLRKKNEMQINILKTDMSKKRVPSQDKSDVAPNYYRAAGNIHGMREMDRLYRIHRTAMQTDLTTRKALADYKAVCREEDAALRESIKSEKASRRDSKWLKYGESGDTAYFYDKSSMEKSKDDLRVWTRHEGIDDLLSDEVARIRINCQKRTIGTIESQIYDESGNLLSKQHNDDVAIKKAGTGSMEEKLISETCK